MGKEHAFLVRDLTVASGEEAEETPFGDKKKASLPTLLPPVDLAVEGRLCWF